MNKRVIKSVYLKVVACCLAVFLITSPMVDLIPALTGSAAALQDNAVNKDTAIQYQINARIDEKTMHIKGTQTVAYRNTSSDTLKELVFHTFADANRSPQTQSNTFKNENEQIQQEHPDKKADDFLGGIHIQSVMMNGQALFFTNHNQALTVQLSKRLQPGETATVQISFDVKIPYGIQRLSYYNDMINGAHWFPVASVYNEEKHEWDKTAYSTTFESDYYTSSDFEVHVNVPDSYQILMPGAVTVQKDSEKAGRKIVSAVANNTREFVFFASPNYKVERVERNGLTIEYYYLDNMPDKQKIVGQYIDTAFNAIQFFNKKYGAYPYPEFRIVETYVKGVAVEFSRVIQMGLIDEKADPAHDYTFIHEIAHQWFHAVIGNNSETESFLDEGFADFSMAYYAQQQGDVLNGFNSIQIQDVTQFNLPIASTNKVAGDLANPIFYQKGRQAIYQLYRMVGETRFDAFMKQYVERYKFKNATIEGLLQTIGDTLGSEAKVEMDKALHDPHFTLKAEYQLTQEEALAYWHEQFVNMYRSSLAQVPNLPEETMSRIVDKALHGEPLTIVLGDSTNSTTKKQQEKILAALQGTLDVMGLPYKVVNNRQTIKQQINNELAGSNIIAIGSTRANGLIQALKPDIIHKTKALGFDWKGKTSLKTASGAYIIKHPYNQDRLLLHFFWNEDALHKNVAEQYAAQMVNALNFSSDFYQYYAMDKTGAITADKKVSNPLAGFFAEQ